jgi:hypothetical protein
MSSAFSLPVLIDLAATLGHFPPPTKRRRVTKRTNKNKHGE